MTGPRRLRELVQGWQPVLPRDDDDTGSITELAAAWGDVVGADVARRTRPGKLRDGTLTVYTAGSTWSHQLSFLAARIVQALCERVPRSGVKRLRFIVASGRTKALLDGATSAASRLADARGQGSPGSAEAPPFDDDPASIVAALRQRQRALDARRERDGWARCERCGSWRAPATDAQPCAVCDDAQRQAADARVERMLLDAPWLSAADLAQAPAADVAALDRVKRRLSTRFETQLRAARKRMRRGELDAGDRMIAWSYCMLLAGLPQHRIGRAVIARSLGQDWADALAGPARAQSREASDAASQNIRKTTARVFTRRDTT